MADEFQMSSVSRKSKNNMEADAFYNVDNSGLHLK